MSVYDVIVLGTGGVGASALYHAARRGANVLGIDRFPPGHDRGSSHGETRLIRQAYYEHPDYVPLVQRAYTLWEDLEQQTGQRLYHEVGILQVGRSDGEIVRGVRASAQAHALAVEELAPSELKRRFPGFDCPVSLTALYEPRAGFLRVEQCVRAYADLAKTAGATLLAGETVQRWKPTAGGVEVTTDNGVHRARSLIITAGAWAGDFLAPLGIRLEVVRKSLYWFEASSHRYEIGHGGAGFIMETPTGNFYGFPSYGPYGVKVAEHTGGHPVTDPLNVSRDEDPEETARVVAFNKAFLPELTSNTTRFATCLYTLSPDRNFIVDRHPEAPQVCFAAGLSGHGFKFTSVLGEVLSDWSLSGATRQPVEFLNCRRPSLRSTTA